MFHRLNARVKFATTCRKESRTTEFQFDGGSHPPNQRHEAMRQEIERRRKRIVGAALQCKGAGSVSRQERRQDRLKHQRCAACGSHGKAIVPRGQRTRTKFKSLRPEPRPDDFGDRNGFRGLHGGQVLTQQTGFLPSGPNLFQPEGLSGHQRQGQ